MGTALLSGTPNSSFKASVMTAIWSISAFGVFVVGSFDYLNKLAEEWKFPRSDDGRRVIIKIRLNLSVGKVDS